MIVGLSGKIGSGKSTTAQYLKTRHGFRVLSTKDFLLAVLNAKRKSGSRKNLQDLGAEIISVAGGGGFVAMMLEYLPEGNYVFDAIRHPDAITYLRRRYGKGYLHIHLILSDEVRHSRVRKGGRSEQSLSNLMKAEKARTERGNATMQRLADYVVTNDGSVQSLKVKLDHVFKKTDLRN